MLCYTCARATVLSLMDRNIKAEQTFTTTGFQNWKKAIEKCESHEKSANHRHAVNQMQSISTLHCCTAEFA